MSEVREFQGFPYREESDHIVWILKQPIADRKLLDQKTTFVEKSAYEQVKKENDELRAKLAIAVSHISDLHDDLNNYQAQQGGFDSELAATYNLTRSYEAADKFLDECENIKARSNKK